MVLESLYSGQRWALWPGSCTLTVTLGEAKPSGHVQGELPGDLGLGSGLQAELCCRARWDPGPRAHQ